MLFLKALQYVPSQRKLVNYVNWTVIKCVGNSVETGS